LVSLAGLGIVVYVLQGIDLAKTGEALLEASPIYLGLGLVLVAFSALLRTVRWGFLLRPRKDIPWLALVSPLLIGYAIGNITATGLGGIPRSMLVARKEGMDTAFVLGTVMLEFVLDAAVVVSWATVAGFLMVLPPALSPLPYLLALFALSIYLLIIAFRRRRSILLRVLPLGRLAPLAQRLPEAVRAGWQGFLDGLSVPLNHGPILIPLSIITLCVWVVESLLFWVLILAVGIPLALPAGSAVMAFTHVVIGIPSLPGFVGTLDAAALTSLQTLGFAGARALSSTLVIHAYLIVPLTVAGALFAWREGVTLAWRGTNR
jgi:hypothetical protein